MSSRSPISLVVLLFMAVVAPAQDPVNCVELARALHDYTYTDYSHRTTSVLEVLQSEERFATVVRERAESGALGGEVVGEFGLDMRHGRISNDQIHQMYMSVLDSLWREDTEVALKRIAMTISPEALDVLGKICTPRAGVTAAVVSNNEQSATVAITYRGLSVHAPVIESVSASAPGAATGSVLVHGSAGFAGKSLNSIPMEFVVQRPSSSEATLVVTFKEHYTPLAAGVPAYSDPELAEFALALFSANSILHLRNDRGASDHYLRVEGSSRDTRDPANAERLKLGELPLGGPYDTEGPGSHLLAQVSVSDRKQIDLEDSVCGFLIRHHVEVLTRGRVSVESTVVDPMRGLISIPAYSISFPIDIVTPGGSHRTGELRGGAVVTLGTNSVRWVDHPKNFRAVAEAAGMTARAGEWLDIYEQAERRRSRMH